MSHRSKSSQQRQRSSEDSPNSLYKEVFLEFQQELDCKYDKHERLVKLSRDCTIRSKRVIFALHRISGNEERRDSILNEAQTKIRKEILGLLKSIAEEIKGEDPKKHHSAFSPGIQEFIEAIAYLQFLTSNQLITMDEVQSYLHFRASESDTKEVDLVEVAGTLEENDFIELPLDPLDYVLGIADLTGEIMRLCINCVGCGDRDTPFKLVNFMRAMYCGFLSLRPIGKEMGRKTSVLKSSLLKVEKVCYTLKIRGSEMPQNMLLHVITESDNNTTLQDEF